MSEGAFEVDGRIEADCRAIVRALETTGDPMTPVRRSALYRFLDGVLLELWQTRPALLPGIFRVLFLKNPADRVLRFLDERAGFFDIVRLVWSLPFRPFLASSLTWLVRRWFGRRGASGAA